MRVVVDLEVRRRGGELQARVREGEWRALSDADSARQARQPAANPSRAHYDSTPRLQPCPFCGTSEARVVRYSDDRFEVECPCGATAPDPRGLRIYHASPTAAADAWNRRA